MAEEVVGTVEPVKKVAGFAGEKYNARKTVEDEEKELEELKQEQSAEEDKAQKAIEDNIEPDNAEERTFKTIAIKKAKEQAEDLETKMKEINNLQTLAKKEKAEAELFSIHPDFEDIRSTDDFHQWAEEQPKWVQEALYENETDARSAARAIDLYKVDKDMIVPKSKKTSNNKSAAEQVNTRNKKSNPENKQNSSQWRESTVDKMSADEYEKNSEEIMEAIRSGKFIYDLSGEAR